MDDNIVKLIERITRVEQNLNAEIEQRKKLDAIVEDMRDIVSEIRHMRHDLQSINTKVNALEEQPAKRWDTVIYGIIGAVAGGIGTMIISMLVGGGA